MSRAPGSSRARIGHLGGYVVLVILLTAGMAQGLAGSNTVYSDDIVDGQVTYADLRDNAMTGKKILDRSITGADLAAGSVGLSRLGGTWTSAVRETLYGNLSGYAYAPCPSGRTAITGSASTPSAGASMMSSVPLNDGWFASFRNWYAADTWIEVSALCIPK